MSLFARRINRTEATIKHEKRRARVSEGRRGDGSFIVQPEWQFILPTRRTEDAPSFSCGYKWPRFSRKSLGILWRTSLSRTLEFNFSRINGP